MFLALWFVVNVVDGYKDVYVYSIVVVSSSSTVDSNRNRRERLIE